MFIYALENNLNFDLVSHFAFENSEKYLHKVFNDEKIVILNKNDKRIVIMPPYVIRIKRNHFVLSQDLKDNPYLFE